MATPRELFIYYRARPAEADALQSRVLAFQHRLRARHPGLVTRLLRRPEPDDGWQTWMETYALPSDPEGITPALERQIGQLASALLGPEMPEPRHVEVFTPCAS